MKSSLNVGATGRPVTAQIDRTMWYWAHALAVTTAAAGVWVIARRADIALSQTPALQGWEVVAMTGGAIAAFWFWGWMLAHYWQNRPQFSSRAWGLILVLGTWAGALAYFIGVWRPRHGV